MPRNNAAQLSLFSSLFIIVLILNLVAITWYFWALPEQNLDKWKKVLSTVGSWVVSLLGFFGIKLTIGKKYPIPQILSMLSVRGCILIFTVCVWFFVLPFHSIALTVRDVESHELLAGVTARLDGENAPRTQMSDRNGHLQIAGLLSATHSIDLEKVGYAANQWSASFAEVLSLRRVNDVSLEKLKGKAALNSDPPGATIFLDGNRQQSRGTTPQTLQLPIGDHTVLFDKRDYISTAWEPVTVAAQGEATFSRSLEKQPRHVRIYTVTVSSDPEGASIFVDSVFKGTTIRQIRVSMGEHRIELKMPGYVLVRDKVRIPEQTVFAYELKRSGQP